MASYEDQLAALRTAQASEVAAQHRAIAKLEGDLAQMQQDTETLEKEERQLQRQFGGGNGEKGGRPSEVGTYVKSILKGTLEGDEGKCRMR